LNINPGLEYFKLRGITNDGELIYGQNTMLETFHVIYIYWSHEKDVKKCRI